MEKTAKTLKNDALLFIIIILALNTFTTFLYIYSFISTGNTHNIIGTGNTHNIIGFLILTIIQLILPCIIYRGAINKKMYAGIWGIAYGILLILSFNLVMILGIFMIIHSIKYLKVYNE